MKQNLQRTAVALALSIGAAGLTSNVLTVGQAEAGVLDRVKGAAKSVGGAVKDGAGAVKKGARAIGSEIKKRAAFKEGAKLLGNGIKDQARKAGSAIKDGAKAIGRGAKTFGGVVKDCNPIAGGCKFDSRGLAPPRARYVDHSKGYSLPVLPNDRKYMRPSAGLPAPGGLKPKPNPTGPIVPEKYPNWGHGKPGDFDNGKRPGQHATTTAGASTGAEAAIWEQTYRHTHEAPGSLGAGDPGVSQTPGDEQ